MRDMKNLYKLFKIQNLDLLCLISMERNGILFNTEKAMKHAGEIEAKLQTLYARFKELVECDVVSITSNDHLSAVLYGGVIVDTIRIAIGIYRTGAKAGQPRYKLEEVLYTLPRLVSPIPKTETAKSQQRIDKGIETEHTLWEVNEPVLRSLKAKGKAKEVLTIILEYSKLEKLRGTYLEGYTKLIEEMNWEHNMLHTSFNQCVAITGRLSSSKPNMQNADKETKRYMESRFHTECGLYSEGGEIP